MNDLNKLLDMLESEGFDVYQGATDLGPTLSQVLEAFLDDVSSREEDYAEGFDEGFEDGIDIGRESGYESGYEDGYREAKYGRDD